MKNATTVLGLLLSSLVLPGCAPTIETADVEQVVPVKSSCQTSLVKLDTDFPTGNIASCKASGETRLDVTLAPEDAPPINCSAWYAFRLTPSRAGSVTVNLTYEACGHRYWPKISEDGVKWDYLPKKNVTVEEIDGSKQARIKVKLGVNPVFIAGQEIFAPSTYRAWLERVSKSPDAAQWLLGKSAEGRNIPGMTIKAAGSKPKEQVVLVGRQHPPEVTGALAMLPFVEALLSDDPVAEQYRARFETVIVPMLNPDGVVRGYWRHNTGGVDLNRDWGPFTQQETKLMDGLLRKIEESPDQKLRLLLDFHSTQKDVFYTIPDEYPTNPPLFIRDWLARYQTRMPDYNVNRDARHSADRPISKAYTYETYGAPTVTFEIGDETDRELIKRIGKESAIAMMETLLATDAP
ncbi:MAG: M14-type cytosolic carboxypeptidase [Parasphingorhabdus sp.]